MVNVFSCVWLLVSYHFLDVGFSGDVIWISKLGFTYTQFIIKLVQIVFTLFLTVVFFVFDFIYVHFIITSAIISGVSSCSYFSSHIELYWHSFRIILGPMIAVLFPGGYCLTSCFHDDLHFIAVFGMSLVEVLRVKGHLNTRGFLNSNLNQCIHRKRDPCARLPFLFCVLNLISGKHFLQLEGGRC